MAKAKQKGSKRGGGGGATSKMDALKLLKQDHDKVKKAFKQFEKMDHDDPAAHELAAQTIADIKLHEAEVEHKSAKLLIKDLDSIARRSDVCGDFYRARGVRSAPCRGGGRRDVPQGA